MSIIDNPQMRHWLQDSADQERSHPDLLEWAKTLGTLPASYPHQKRIIEVLSNPNIKEVMLVTTSTPGSTNDYFENLFQK